TQKGLTDPGPLQKGGQSDHVRSSSTSEGGSVPTAIKKVGTSQALLCPPYKSLRRRHRPALMRHQQSPDLRSRYRRAEQKTLHLRAAELAQHLALPFLLDAFRRRR